VVVLVLVVRGVAWEVQFRKCRLRVLMASLSVVEARLGRKGRLDDDG